MACGGKQWESMFECGKDPNAPTPTRWTMLRLFLTALTSVRIGTPKRTALRMIRWYQDNVSAGRDLCSRPAPYNCSNRAAWFVGSYGVLLGMLFAWSAMRHDYGPKGCCGDD